MAVSAETRRHVGRFLVVGGTSVAIDLTMYVGAMTLGLAREPAKAVGYLAGMIFGFIANKTWTFGSRQSVSREAVTYGLLYAATFLINVAVNGATVHLLQDAMSGRGAIGAGFLVATGLTTVLNFLGMRFITFRRGIADRQGTKT